MQKCKITVLKTTFDEELAQKYAVDGFGPCPLHKEGDVFITDHNKPEALCTQAWNCIHHFVFALSLGADYFFWGWNKEKGVAITSCNDGMRPVIFKIERMEE